MFQVNHVWHSKVTITVGSNNQQARNANCMWWFPLTVLDAVSGTFTSIKDCETLNWSSMMFRRICVIRNLQWILDHGISNFPPSQWCQWWFICGLSSLMAPGQNRKHGWPKVLRGVLPCVENQTKIFAWWSNIYDISIWVFWRLACFSHTVVPDELDAGSDQDLWSHLGNEMSTICWWYLAIFLSCILWYIMLYTSLYIYILCVYLWLYIILYLYLLHIYIYVMSDYIFSLPASWISSWWWFCPSSLFQEVVGSQKAPQKNCHLAPGICPLISLGWLFSLFFGPCLFEVDFHKCLWYFDIDTIWERWCHQIWNFIIERIL